MKHLQNLIDAFGIEAFMGQWKTWLSSDEVEEFTEDVVVVKDYDLDYVE